MKVAIFGCTHGAFDRVYEEAKGADLVLLTGDLETIRDNLDL
jgi:hypothetical protein